MTADPRTYEYSRPKKTCDVVMKAGSRAASSIRTRSASLPERTASSTSAGTSGARSPLPRRLRPSTGAKSGGFAKLATLPESVGAGDNLFRLFQPQPGTRRFYGSSPRGSGTPAPQVLRIVGAALAGFPSQALAGLAPGLALVVVAALTGSVCCSSARSSPGSCSPSSG